MNGIIGMTELTLDSDLNRSQRESLLLVHSLARSLLLIIDDILDISKSESNADIRVGRGTCVDRMSLTSRGGSNDDGASFVFIEVHRVWYSQDTRRSRGPE